MTTEFKKSFNSIMLSVMVLFIVFGISYLIGAFTELSFNIEHWKSNTRSTVGVAVLLWE